MIYNINENKTERMKNMGKTKWTNAIKEFLGVVPPLPQQQWAEMRQNWQQYLEVFA